MDPSGLTPRQRDALEAIRRFASTAGHAPSYAELAAALGVTRAAAHELVRALLARGAVVHQPGRARTLALPPRGRSA